MSERSIPYPEVRIRNGWALTELVSPHLPTYSRTNRNATPLPSSEAVKEVVANYKEAWTPRQDLILPGMCRILDLSFRHNIIDANIVPGFDAVSQPLIIGTDYDPDHFVDVLTHDLLHTLLVDNTRYEEGSSIFSHWEKLFGVNHSPSTLIHIPVHAGLEAIYRDVLDDPGRLERDKANSKGKSGYVQAWNYVEKLGYGAVIDQLVTTHHILAENKGRLDGPGSV